MPLIEENINIFSCQLIIFWHQRILKKFLADIYSFLILIYDGPNTLLWIEHNKHDNSYFRKLISHFADHKLVHTSLIILIKYQ